jgi:hypothetical protein
MKEKTKNRYTFSLVEKKRSNIVRGELDFDNMVRVVKINFILLNIHNTKN